MEVSILKRLIYDHRVYVVFCCLVILITLPFVVYASRFEACEPIFEKGDHLSTYFGHNKHVVFCINDNTSLLQSMHIYDCQNVSKFTKWDTLKIYNSLKRFFSDETTAS